MGPQNNPKAKNTQIRFHISSHRAGHVFRYKTNACHRRFSVLVFNFEDIILRNVKPFSLLNCIFRRTLYMYQKPFGQNNNLELCVCIRCSNVWMLIVCLVCSVCSWCFVLILCPVLWLHNNVHFTYWAFS